MYRAAEPYIRHSARKRIPCNYPLMFQLSEDFRRRKNKRDARATAHLGAFFAGPVPCKSDVNFPFLAEHSEDNQDMTCGP
jgi:hypothetical protein